MQGDLQADRFSSNLKAVSGPHPFDAGQEVMPCASYPLLFCFALLCPVLLFF